MPEATPEEPNRASPVKKKIHVGHACKLTWIIKNISNMGRPDRRIEQRFSLDEMCRVYWFVYAMTDRNGQLHIGLLGSGNPRVWLAEGSNLRVTNLRNDCYAEVSRDLLNPSQEQSLEIKVEMSKSLENSVIVSKNGFEVVKDVLVVKADIFVEECCSMFEIEKCLDMLEGLQICPEEPEENAPDAPELPEQCPDESAALEKRPDVSAALEKRPVESEALKKRPDELKKQDIAA